MSINQHRPSRVRRRLVLSWLAMRDAYDFANVLSHHVLGFLLKTALVAYFICAAVLLTVRYAVLPHIDRYQADVTQLASNAVGRPVSFDTMSASWRGLRPQLVLTNVVVHDRHDQAALILPKVSATVAWSSLLRFNLQLQQLEIIRPDVDIRRDADGKLYVGGMYIDTHKPGDGKGLDWMLSQDEIAIRGGTVRWNDASRAAPELALSGVDFVLRNDWRRHRFALKATPPAAYAKPLDVRADFEHPRFVDRISDFSKWTGQVYADVRDTDLAVWKAYVDYPVEVRQGRGSVRAWLDFDRARVADFTADLHLSNVWTRLRKDLQPLDLVNVNGRIAVREVLKRDVPTVAPTFGKNGHAVSLTDFSFVTQEGLVFPTTTLSESYVPAKAQQPEKIEVKAKLLDLHTLADFAERLPLPAGQREMLADFMPRGQLKNFSAQWQGSYPNLSAYSIQGQFIGLSMNAQPARPARARTASTPAQAAVPAVPGFENLTGSIDANDKEGRFSLASSGLKLNLSGYFNEHAMPFDRLDMQAGWQFQRDDQLLLQIDRMDFVQDGVSGSLAGKHLMPLNTAHGKRLGQIDMVAKLNEFDVSKTGRFLPLQTSEHLRSWLGGALMEGKIENVAIKLKGNLADFPFHGEKTNGKPKGEFSVTGRIVGGKLNYVPDMVGKDRKGPLWPLAEDIQGTIRFDRTRMEILADTAKTNGVDLYDVKAVIPDLLAHDTLLDIQGNASGALQQFVQYVNASPVEEWIGQFTEETRASGQAKLDLKLHLPLARLEQAKAQGTLQFAGNDIVLFNAMPVLSATSGKLEFNEAGFSLAGLKAGFLGAPLTISGGTQYGGDIVVKANGGITADGVRKAYAAPAMQRLSKYISGSTRYTAAIVVKKKGRPEITVDSSMQGLGLDFPAPLNKAANDTLPLKVRLSESVGDNAAVMRDEISLSLGSALAARYERQKEADKNASWRVLRGGIGINVPAPQPDSGVIANVSLRSLNIDTWNDFVSSIVGTDKPGPSATTNTIDLAQYIDPDVLAARTTELVVGGKKLDNVVVGASHQNGLWQANIDAEQVSGYVTWEQASVGRGLGKVTARLASLTIPKSAASDVSDLLGNKKTAAQIPALDIVTENFEWLGKRFGHFELVANNVRASVGREWRISRLAIQNPDGTLSASGKWLSQGGDDLSSLNYTIDIVDAGKLLERFGFASVLRGGRGKMQGDISWHGLPFSLDIPSLSGRFALDLGGGQFLKVDRAANLLGVLSLQSLPRRLTLDFRDVFSEGFAFDGIIGNAQIANGIVKTDNFKMRGVSATVLMDGMADIAKETTNLHVVVIPEINAGAASIVYGLVVNPVIGVGTFLAQLFLRAPLMRAFTFEYQIAGPWKDPVVTKLARKTDQANGQSGAAGATASLEKVN